MSLFACLVSLCSSLALPNVVLLSVDTLRADHLGCYGYPLPATPRLDQLASHALLFEDCVCETPLTNPSFSSMLASKPPRTIGTTRNGLPIPSDVPTVVELFNNAGYYTFCIQSNWTLKRRLSGLHRGFDHYDDDFHTRRWGLFKTERYADEVTALAVALLEQRNPKQPFFTWIHYSDPHTPYRFHEAFNPTGRKPQDLDRKARTHARYDSEVAFTDHHIGILLDALPEEDTFIVFVADHGESLYEHDYLGHGRRIHQTGMHIPLLISGPGITPGRNTSPVRGIDIGPTLLALAGLPPLTGARGVSLVTSSIPSDRIRIVETYGGAVPAIPGVKALLADSEPRRQGAYQNGWKLIVRDDSPLELYHLVDDPHEETNCLDSRPDIADKLFSDIKEWVEAGEIKEADPASLSDEDVEALKAAGYL